MHHFSPQFGIYDRWRVALLIPGFRNKLIFFSVGFICFLIAFPYFFNLIQNRSGYHIPDPLLDVLPARDFSFLTFSIVWCMSAFFMIRMIQQPFIALLGIAAIDLIFLTRMITIFFLPLEPPPGLITLWDPISNFFYGEKYDFVTRDLFFSGHTSTQIMIGLVLPGKKEKLLAFTGATLVGLLVLVQHIHYTIDVVGALLFTWILYRIARAIVADVSFDQKASPN